MAFVRPLSWLLAAGVATAGEAPVPTLTQAEMQPLLQALQAGYARPRDTGYEALNQAAIEGLLRAHPDTIQLVTVPENAPAQPPLLQARLTPAIACLRPGSFRPEDAATLKEALTALAGTETSTVILDLRAPAPDAEPAVVAAFAGLFLPRDTVLFTLDSPVKTAAEPVWTRPLMVLIDRDTCNAGEILAAVLQRNHRAFLLGATTRGRTAAITSLPVRRGDGGVLTLQFTGRPAGFPAGPDPFGKGVVPDMPVKEDEKNKAAVFALQAKEGPAATVIHPPRPRVNEAALVAGVNPEWPDRISKTSRPSTPEPQPLTDHALRQAMDIAISKSILDPAK